MHRQLFFLPLAMFVVLIMPASAQQSAIIQDPVWLVAPAAPRLPAEFNAQDYRPEVSLACTVSEEGVLTNCRPNVPNTPEAFAESAIQSVAAARVASQERNGAPTLGRTLDVTARFPIPVMDRPPPSPHPQLVIVNAPVWIDQPSPEIIARYYPSEALSEGLSGVIDLRCLVGSSGIPSCAVLREEPREKGFGQAALQLSRHYRMASQPTGAQVTFQMTLVPPG